MLTAEDSAFKVFSNDVNDDNIAANEVPEPLQTSSRIEVRSRHPELRPYGGMESRDARFSGIDRGDYRSGKGHVKNITT